MGEQFIKTIKLEVAVDKQSFTSAQNELNNLAFSFNQRVSDGLTNLGHQRANSLAELELASGKLHKEVKVVVETLQRDLGQMWNKEWDTAFDSVGTALTKSITLGFSDGLGRAKPFWEKAWIDLASVPEQYLAGALGKLASSFLDSLTNSLTNAVLKPLGDALGVTSFLKGSLGSVTSFAASAGSTVAGWLGIAPAAGGAAA